MRPIVAAALICFTAAPTFAADRLPTFPKHMAYEKVREGMLALGWKPALVPGAICYESRTDMCRPEWPEVFQCIPTGFGKCSAMWRKGEAVVEVETVQEDPGQYTRTICRANCT